MEKLGSTHWSEPGIGMKNVNVVEEFQHDIHGMNVTNSVVDLLNLTRQRHQRQFVGGDNTSTMKVSKSTPRLGKTKGVEENHVFSSHHHKYSNLHERPPRRLEIDYLENELTEVVKYILNPVSDEQVYQPQKDRMILIRNRIFSEFQVELNDVEEEPWIETVVKAECLKESCDEVGLKLTDMMSVNSTELGNVMRKLKYTYSECFSQMSQSWKALRSRFKEISQELEETKSHAELLEQAISEKEYDIKEKVDAKVADIKKQFQIDKEKDQEKIRQAENQLEQMSTTLKSLNAIFKTMQSDVDAAKAADTLARCNRLEREVAELEAKVVILEKSRKELGEEKEKNMRLEEELSKLKNEIANLSNEVHRRDATITSLMEREALRNAEIEKLQRMAAQKAESDEDLAIDPVATSVLCIKCKKSLDDISNIRDAILGSQKNGTIKISCQSYRLLLPNNKGRRPYRSIEWLKLCMRSILVAKMKEVLSMLPIKGQISGFPEFVYAWFEPNGDGLDSAKYQMAVNQADEDRWGLYYGVKMLSKDNAEAKLFWSLLDEAVGEDGLTFACYCLSVAFTIGGEEMWKQFYSCLNSSTYHSIPTAISQNVTKEYAPSTVWLKLESAYAGTRAILVRALEPQIAEAIESIEALKVIPKVEVYNEETKKKEGESEDQADQLSQISEDESKLPDPNSTHIDFFLWMRIMLQRFNDEQCHRKAAIRLMFDTASMGALLPQSSTESNQELHDSDNPNVLFPQFVAIVRTLYPSISMTELSNFYVLCYHEGGGKVTPTAFHTVAERISLFTRALHLAPLPVFEYWNLIKDGFVSNKPTLENKASADLADLQEGASHHHEHEQFYIIDRTLPINSQIPIFDIQYCQKMRGQIGSLVHRSFTLILPEIRNQIKHIPESWRSLILEQIECVRLSLQEFFQKMKADKRGGKGGGHSHPISHADGSLTAHKKISSTAAKKLTPSSSERFIDGFLPFVQYHRLLTLVLTVKSFSENMLLPISFVTSREGGGDAQGKGAENLVYSLSFRRAESLLATLESSLMSHTFDPIALKRYQTFNFTRKSILIRKIQSRFKKFLTMEMIVPRLLRYQMRPGYIKGDPGMALRSRRVFMEPWAAQSYVALIYMLKLSLDRRAAKHLRTPISFAHVIVSLLYMLYGIGEIAERVLHDLCLSVQAYSPGLPRLRMFACFIGSGELEEPMATIFQSEYAVNTYLDLLALIHKEINISSNALNINHIATLFPSSEDPSSRSDKKDLWTANVSTLKNALIKWSQSQQGIKDSIYLNSMNKVKTDGNGVAEVDDFLWVMMQTWAKNIVSKVRTADEKSQAYAVKEIGSSGMTATNRSVTPSRAKTPTEIIERSRKAAARLQRQATGVGGNVEEDQGKISFAQCSNISTIQALVNSIHAAELLSEGKTELETDLLNCCASVSDFVKSTRKCNIKMLSNLLVSCASSDFMSGDYAQENEQERNQIHFLSVSVQSPIAATLSIRLFNQWWALNKKGIGESLEQLGLIKTNTKKASAAEIERSTESIRRVFFRIEQILIETQASVLESPSKILGCEPEHIQMMSTELWEAVSSLLTQLEVILKATNIPFPRDQWKAGRKLHLDRSTSYLMQPQPNFK